MKLYFLIFLVFFGGGCGNQYQPNNNNSFNNPLAATRQGILVVSGSNPPTLQYNGQYYQVTASTPAVATTLNGLVIGQTSSQNTQYRVNFDGNFYQNSISLTALVAY